MKSSINWLEMFDWKKEHIEDLRFIGYCYIKQGKYDIAISFFEALALLAPNNCYELQTLGALYLQKGKHLEALNYLDQSLKIDTQHYPSLINKAKALLFLGYKKQGFALAKTLEHCQDLDIQEQTKALLLSYS